MKIIPQLRTHIPYVNRDISWLSFNYRVLQEAKDPSVPLMERIKFLAIFSSNLDEFFRVRVANHRNFMRVGKKTKRELDFDPEETIQQILTIVNRHQLEFSNIFENQIIPGLKKYGIHLLRRTELDKHQKEFVENFFNEHLLPFVQPVLLVKDKIKPFLNNASIYLTVTMKDPEKSSSGEQYAIVKIPSDYVKRFIILPPHSPNRKDIIMLDDIVRESMRLIFPGFEIIDTFSIKLTRDAELYIEDEYSGDLIEKIKRSLSKRNVGPASRLVYDRSIPEDLLHYLMNAFDISKFDLSPEGRYHNNFDFFNFPNFEMTQLMEQPLPPLPIEKLEESVSIFTEIAKQDYMIQLPYHSYESVIKFFEDASKDPNVTHIKIVQYRVAKESRIMKALMQSVRAGKQVSAFIEVKARFDEEANLIWGEKLENNGVNVHYSIPGLKVHSKMALIRRIENGKAVFYCFLSTGNFHEITAKIYSDTGIFTADPRLTKECTRLFSYLETKQIPSVPFEYLIVGQFNLKNRLIDLVKYEIEEAKVGKEASIVLKMNSLQDKEMVNLLYKASQAGVRIKLIIRGICSLVAGVPGISENIEAISIVDRFLEHSRVFIFHHSGKELVFLSSADWMVRNLHHRIETVFPVFDEEIQKTIKDIIRIQLSDNVKARIISQNQKNEYKKDHSDLAVRSQIETYYYIKRIHELNMREAEEATNEMK